MFHLYKCFLVVDYNISILNYKIVFDQSPICSKHLLSTKRYEGLKQPWSEYKLCHFPKIPIIHIPKHTQLTHTRPQTQWPHIQTPFYPALTYTCKMATLKA